MRGEGIGQPQIGRELRAEGAGTEDPDLDVLPLAGHGAQRLAFGGGAEVFHQFHDVAREVVHVAGEVPPHRPRRHLVRSRRAAEAEIDPARMQRRERAELLGDDQRRVVGQHDAAGADADALRALRGIGQRHRRRGAGDAGHVVVFRHPEAPVAERIGMAGEVAGMAQRLAGVAAFRHRGEIEDRERDHPPHMSTRGGDYRRSISAMAAAGLRCFSPLMTKRKTSRGTFFVGFATGGARSSSPSPFASALARFAQASSAFGA